MSVNLHLLFRVSGYNPSRVSAIKQAVESIFERQDISDDMSPLEESSDGPERVLSSRSDPQYPVIISSAYKWIPEVQTALSEAVVTANGGTCEVQFEGEDADECNDDDDDAE